MRFPISKLTLAFLVLLAVAAGPAAATNIRVQSTTDTVDAGLVNDVIIPGYKAAQPGDELLYTAVGTGRALENARAGLADVVITHAPSLETQFVNDGFDYEDAGRAIFYSDYVIVAPLDDPAGVLSNTPHDAVGAFERIAAAGAAGKASFVSRGDNSGTNVQEQIMWGLTDPALVNKHKSSNAGTATNRYEPDANAEGTGPANTYPNWYVKSNQGQGANLQTTGACTPTGTYPSGKCYTIVDRGTFNRSVNKGLVNTLRVVSQNNDSGARGGKDLLINPFSVHIVDPNAPFAAQPSQTPDVAAATRFVNYLVSKSFQDAVDNYPTATDPAFRQDAYPSVTTTSALPSTATAGSTVSLNLKLANRVPGEPAINAMPVQLQQSTDNGASYTDVGAPATSDGAGNVSFSPTITATTRYRVSLSRFQTTGWNAFSPNTQDVGLVAVPSATAPAPTPLTKAPTDTRAPADRSAPRLSKRVLTSNRVQFSVSEAATVKLAVTQRTSRKRGKRRVVTYRKVKSASLRTKKAGTVALRYRKALAAGTYRVTIRLTDASGNVKRVTYTLKVKAKKT